MKVLMDEINNGAGTIGSGVCVLAKFLVGITNVTIMEL